MGNVILLAFSKEHSAAAQSIGKKEVRVETRPVSWLTEGSRLEDVMKSKQFATLWRCWKTLFSRAWA